MITCSLKINDDVKNLHKIFLSEPLSTERANCRIKKSKSLGFSITAKDPVSMRAITTSILKIIETYYKAKELK